MLDKTLISKNFSKSLNTYNDYALIQKDMAKKLISLIKKKKFNNILEIGSYTGFLTQLAVENFEFNNYLALDIINSFDFIKNLSPKINFLKEDIENFQTDKKFDLIIANASLQWCNDLENVIKKLKTNLADNGLIAISIFSKKNFIEIKETFNIGLNYFSIEEIKSFFSTKAIIQEEIKTLQFKNPNEILEHLKKTGVNSVSKKPLKISVIKKNLKILEEKYQNQLTYNPIYIID